MLATLRRLLSEGPGGAAAGSPDDGGQPLAQTIAILLVEIACIDHDFDPREAEQIAALLARRFDLSTAEAEALVAEARRRRDESISFHPLVRQLNEALSRRERFELLRLLWSVAWADGHIDKYEEHQIRKLAEWLHLPHVDFVRARHEVQQEQMKAD
ncbi:MAG: hypothetical protein D6717_08900 [Gammaproteobacteria bacterium]|nr:MAG: hypothetical protein D6717_08900 [Gammaproteobacteria bacterium]